MLRTVFSFRFAAVTVLSLGIAAIAFALPGVDPPPEIAAQIAPRLRPGQAAALVMMQDATIEQVHVYVSEAGLRHLRFVLTAAGETHPAIMYEADWTELERELLESGHASLVGLWETFRGSPSFTAKLVFGASVGSSPTVAEAAVAEADLVRIDGALVHDVAPFFGPDGENHVGFRFSVPVDPRTFEAIVRDGTWTRDMVLKLRTGTATLVGVWDQTKSAPVFIVEEVR